MDKVLDAIPDLPEKFNLQVSEKQKCLVIIVMILTKES